ncbi:VOC family protein [Pseudonocardia acaciae]|uniref:VOC family protein n=1 Tax=Pseudonocardia acaciae TaxID=551276 RepID=UPI00068698AB|nr:VOC family protein [Pseudonocardia acaciae]
MSQEQRARIAQIGVVVRDMRATMEEYHRTLGWGPWSVFVLDGDRHHHTHLHGRPSPYSMRIAVTTVGGIDYELIEPLEGPSIYKEFLAAHGEGIHHILCDAPDGSAALNQRLTGAGMAISMGGSVGANLEYQYLEAEGVLGGVVIETYSGDVEPPTYVWPGEGTDGAVR